MWIVWITAQHAAAVSSAELQPVEDDVRTQPQNDGILREKLSVNIPKKKKQPKKNSKKNHTDSNSIIDMM